MSISLEITDLKISFPGNQGFVPAVKSISLSIPRAKTVGLVGESGSGKSVTSLAVMQLLHKNAKTEDGRIILHLKDNEKKDVLHLNEKILRKLRGNRISMIFQEPMTALNPVIKCGKQIEEVIHIHQNMTRAEVKKKVLDILTAVQLPHVERIYKSYPHELSGGQKQRLMIAMAMANEPDLLIADEPTTALDVSVQKTILELLRELQNKFGTSILFITHDLGVVADFAHQIAVMYRGEIVETGKTKDVLSNPAHAYTRALLACRPPLHSRPWRLPVIPESGFESVVEQSKNISTEERKAQHEKIYAEKAILEVKDLVVDYSVRKNIFGKTTQSFQAVRAVSFELYKGETLGLVGESGCGKTSLSRAILGLQKASGGHIWWKNQDWLAKPQSDWINFRKDIQIIFQDPYGSLNPVMSVGNAIMEPLLVHRKMDKKHAHSMCLELLDKTGMPASAFDKLPAEFSGGQRQRISIARALAMNPKIIICDESVSALDVSVQAQILNLLNDLKAEFSLSYLFISHDLSVVKYMSDRIMVMKNGTFVEIAEADDLYLHPKHEYTKMLFSSIPGVAAMEASV